MKRKDKTPKPQNPKTPKPHNPLTIEHEIKGGYRAQWSDGHDSIKNATFLKKFFRRIVISINIEHFQSILPINF